MKDGRWFRIESWIFPALVGIPLWAYILFPPTPVKKEPWLPAINPRDYGPSNPRREVEPHGAAYDWERAEKENSHEWFEFLEEIENKGLEPWDPEAIEIWDKSYN